MSEWDDSADEKNGVLEFLDVVSVSWTCVLIKIYANFQCAIVLSVPIYKQLCDLKHHQDYMRSKCQKYTIWVIKAIHTLTMEFGASRIDPIIPKEPKATRQDSSDCLKSACFPFKSAFDDQEEKPGDGMKNKAISIYYS